MNDEKHEKSPYLQPEFTLPYGARLKRMALIGLAHADAQAGSPSKEAIIRAAQALDQLRAPNLPLPEPLQPKQSPSTSLVVANIYRTYG